MAIVDRTRAADGGRASLEAELIAARRYAAELDSAHRRTEDLYRRGAASAADVLAARDRASRQMTEIAALEREALSLVHLQAGESSASPDNGAAATLASLRTSADLDLTRQEILTALRAVAEPLARFQHLAERQRGLTAHVRAVTGSDNGYAAYIDTALFRADEVDATVEFVLEALKKARVVA